jgi:hypothetical protein
MSSSRSRPSAKAPAGVAKISMVYGPGGASDGHVQPRRDREIVEEGRKRVSRSDAHASTRLVPPSAANTTAFPFGHPN